MDYIQRLPYILSLFVTILVGIISSLEKIETKQSYIRMTISIIVFYLIGVYIKNKLLSIIIEMENKKAQQKKEEEEKKEKEEQEKEEQEKEEQALKKKEDSSKRD